MKTNNSIKEICGRLASADSILIFPHTLPDGDTLGSSLALCMAMRKIGKNAHILIEDEIPSYLKFLDGGLCTFDKNIIENPDLCVSVDCADTGRFERRGEKFFAGGATVCIDHHKTSERFADFSYVDSGAAATAEIIYDILREMDIAIDKRMGEAIYAALVTDTGNFQYSNTNVKVHLITVELFNIGIAHEYVSRMLYQNSRIEKLHLAGKIFNTVKRIANGEVITAYVTREMLEETGATMEDTEGISEALRNIGGVEVSIFTKEAAPNETKFSMRSKTRVDVAELSVRYGGGGHARAAGCTVKKPVFEAMKMMEADVEAYFESTAGKK